MSRKARLNMSFRHAAEYCSTDRRLRLMLEELATVWPGTHLSVTSIHRTPEEESRIVATTGQSTSGIHVVGPPYRAIDILAPTWNEVDVMSAVNWLNSRWVYDPERPNMQVAVYKRHGTGPHVHLQVHPNTRERRPEDEEADPERPHWAEP